MITKKIVRLAQRMIVFDETYNYWDFIAVPYDEALRFYITDMTAFDGVETLSTLSDYLGMECREVEIEKIYCLIDDVRKAVRK